MPEEVEEEAGGRSGLKRATDALRAAWGRAGPPLCRFGRAVSSASRRLGAWWLRIPSRARLATVLFVLLLASYCALFFAVPKVGVYQTDGDEMQYLVMTQSLIRDHDLSIKNNFEEKQYREYREPLTPGEVIEPHFVMVKGRMVSTHPAFLSVVLVPGFAAFGYDGAVLTMLLMVALGGMFTFLVLERFTSRVVAAGVTFFMFMTYPLVFYSRLIYPETAALFVLALGVWASMALRETKKPVYAAVAGLSAGLLILLHPKFIALSASLLFLFYLVARKDFRLFAWWAVPAAACLGLLLLITGMLYGPNLLKGLTASGGSTAMGGYLGTNSGVGVWGLFLDSAWGLFIFAPLFMLFPLGLALQNNRREWSAWWYFFPVCIVAHCLVLGVFQSWNGGAAPVARYLIPIASLLVICVGLFVERCRSKVAWAAAAVLSLLQIVTTVWAFRAYEDTYGLARPVVISEANRLLPRFLDNNPVKRILLYVFPYLHPSSARAAVLTVLWVLLYAALIYLARRFYLHHGGGKVSPLADIRPFLSVES